MEQFKLDLKDKKILYQLDINSRQSNPKIAKKVGLSKEVVNYRIKRLEESGIIKGYYTLIDFSKLGYFSIRIYLKLLDASAEKEKEILNFLVNNKATFFVSKIDGFYDIGFGTWIKDIYEFEKFWNAFKMKFKKFIGKDNFSIFTKAYHFHRAYLLDKKTEEKEPETFGGNKIEKYDEKDIKILKLLAKDSRISMVEMSEKLKIPPKTIDFRIKKLRENGIIQGYRFIFDFEILGYEYYKVDLMLKDISRMGSFIQFSQNHPNILYIDQTIGGSDFEFDLEVKDKEHFLEIINQLRSEFPEIREWNYFNLRSYEKLLYFPE